MLETIKMLDYICDHEVLCADGTLNPCGKRRIVTNLDRKIAQKEGWAVGVDKKCYCPEHAPFHRHVGRSGKPHKFVQLKMGGINGE